MHTTKEHAERIKKELQEAGVDSLGMKRFASRFLPAIIHPDEHVEGVVYGRYREQGGFLNFSEGMLVATNLRVIFLDRKPGYAMTDELTYDVVSGVRKSAAGIFSAVTMHTRVGDYTIRFANRKGVDRFVDYIERRRLDSSPEDVPTGSPKAGSGVSGVMDEKALKFLREHDIAVLSTVDRTGNVYGAAVYYVVDDNDCIYILTKSGTQKAHNIFAHHQVALTITEIGAAQTMQLQGTGEVEPDHIKKDWVFESVMRLRQYGIKLHMPPITTLHEGAYMVIRIVPTSVRFTDYELRQKEE